MIPQSRAVAFGEMIRRYAADWTPGGPDNVRVSIDGKSYDLASACSFFEGFDDPPPDDVFNLLWAKIHHGDDDLKEDLGRRKSYSAAARALQLLQKRKARART